MSSNTPFPPDAAGVGRSDDEVPTKEVDGDAVLDTDVNDDLVDSADADALAAGEADDR